MVRVQPHQILSLSPGLHPSVKRALDLIEDEEVSPLLVGGEGLGERSCRNAADRDNVLVGQALQQLGLVRQVDGARTEQVDVPHDGLSKVLDDIPSRFIAADVTVGTLPMTGRRVDLALDHVRLGCRRGIGGLPRW